MLLPVHDNTHTTHVTTACDHDDVTSVELDKVGDFSLINVELDSIVDLDVGVRVTNGTAVVGNDVGDTACTYSNLLHFEELVSGLLGGDTMDGKSALDIVQETEMLSRFFDGDDIYFGDNCQIEILT